MPDLTLALTELAATMPVAALSAGLVYFGWRLRNLSAKSEIMGSAEGFSWIQG